MEQFLSKFSFGMNTPHLINTFVLGDVGWVGVPCLFFFVLYFGHRHRHGVCLVALWLWYFIYNNQMSLCSTFCKMFLEFWVEETSHCTSLKQFQLSQES